jgi:hypothetical protein
VTKDDLPYLKSIAKEVGAAHFGIPAMFKAAYPRKHGSWTVFMKDDLKKIMARLVRDSLAVESAGPRGGAGWKLTDTGVALGLKN